MDINQIIEQAEQHVCLQELIQRLVDKTEGWSEIDNYPNYQKNEFTGQIRNTRTGRQLKPNKRNQVKIYNGEKIKYLTVHG